MRTRRREHAGPAAYAPLIRRTATRGAGGGCFTCNIGRCARVAPALRDRTSRDIRTCRSGDDCPLRGARGILRVALAVIRRGRHPPCARPSARQPRIERLHAICHRRGACRGGRAVRIHDRPVSEDRRRRSSPALIFGVDLGHRGQPRGGPWSGRSSAGSPSTSSGSGPLGSSAFALLIAVGRRLASSAVSSSRVRIIAPVVATAIASPVYSMLLLVAISALTSAPLSAPALSGIVPSAIADAVARRDRRPAHGGDRHAAPGRSDGLVNDTLLGAQPRAGSTADPVRRLRDRHDPRLRPAHDAPRLPPDHQRPRARGAGGDPEHGRGGHPRDTRTDLRPERPPAGVQRRHLRGQDHAVRAAVQPARRRRPAAWRASSGWMRRRSSRPWTARPGSQVRSGPHRPGRPGGHGAAHLRVVNRAPGRPRRRGDPARVPRWPAPLPDPGLHGADRCRHLRAGSRRRATCRTT